MALMLPTWLKLHIIVLITQNILIDQTMFNCLSYTGHSQSFSLVVLHLQHHQLAYTSFTSSSGHPVFKNICKTAAHLDHQRSQNTSLRDFYKATHVAGHSLG